MGWHIRASSKEKDLVRDMCRESHAPGMPLILLPQNLALPLSLTLEPPPTDTGSWRKPALFGMECPWAVGRQQLCWIWVSADALAQDKGQEWVWCSGYREQELNPIFRPEFNQNSEYKVYSQTESSWCTEHLRSPCAMLLWCWLPWTRQQSYPTSPQQNYPGPALLKIMMVLAAADGQDTQLLFG